MAPISIGEIHVPGSSGPGAARCLTLTSPLQQEGGLELFFAILAADAPKRVVEKISERLGEELRAVFFQKGDPEARFEAALKQANKCILAFLYEHGLSLPGIKLRGAVAALSGGNLFVSSRGMMRGLLYVPQSEGLTPYTLFEEVPEKNSEPKFFTSLQAGAFPDGARLVIATSELFQALDDAYVQDILGQEDYARASREIKTALRATQKPVSILSLSSLLTASALAKAASPSAAATKTKASGGRPRATAPIVGPDIGEVIARGVRAGCLLAGRALVAVGRAARTLLKALVLIPLRIPRLIATLINRERRARLIAECKSAPDRCVYAAVGRLNALPHQSRLHFLALLGIGAVFVHGLLFSIRHEVRAQTVKAYEAQLAELQQLEADFAAGMIYDNEARSRELVARMETVLNALPELTESQKKTKVDASASVHAAREKMRKVVAANPTTFASAEAADGFSTLAWFGGKLYVFSNLSGRVQVFSDEGSAAADPTIKALALGVSSVAPARTGFLLQGVNGALVYWNPDTGEESVFETEDVKGQPILFYQGRLYAAAQDGTVTRRSVATKTLGSPADVLRGAPASPTSLATDGAVYLLYKDGTTRKYLKGAVVQDYAPSVIDPAPSNASHLWASADSDKLVFIDQDSSRAFTVDRTTGRLLAQMTAPEFRDLRAATVDDGGRALYLLTASGTIYKVPLK
ncbi:MAG: hypothetical protein QY323_02250 [Patescibacteria group bacterium]|nr:MAG: hypothetical protein QY323_02250 [Patescibacteria group bacterium]